MRTIKELGRALKEKHPEYRDLTDEEAGRMVQASKPGAYSEFIDEKLEDLIDFYNPRNGRLRNWWRGLRSRAGSKILLQLTEEGRFAIEHGAMLEDAARTNATKEVEFRSFVIQHQHELYRAKKNEQILDMAAREGFTVESYQEKLLKDADSRRELRKQTLTHNQEVRMAKVMSRIKLREFEETESIKLSLKLREKTEELRLVMIAKFMAGHQKLILLQELLDSCYRQIEAIKRENLSPETKRRMIEDREQIINHFKEFRNDQGNRLLETRIR